MGAAAMSCNPYPSFINHNLLLTYISLETLREIVSISSSTLDIQYTVPHIYHNLTSSYAFIIFFSFIMHIMNWHQDYNFYSNHKISEFYPSQTNTRIYILLIWLSRCLRQFCYYICFAWVPLSQHGHNEGI